MADYRTEKYLYRIVTSANQLVEKIQIFDAGKDDRVMELRGIRTLYRGFYEKSLIMQFNYSIIMFAIIVVNISMCFYWNWVVTFMRCFM